MAKKTEYMAFLMDPEEKRALEDKAHEVRVTQGEIIRRALAFFLAAESSVSNQDGKQLEEVTA